MVQKTAEMKSFTRFLLLALLAPAVTLSAQTRVWSLQDCIDYAMENNIQLRQSRNAYASGLEDTEQARAALFPSLSASTSQGVNANPIASGGATTGYSGSYGLNSDVTLYSGGKLRTAIRQQEVQNEQDSLSIAQNAMSIRISILQAYMQCLYAAEAVTVNESTVEVARAQRDRAQEMWKAGSISKVDFAQMESQLSGDMYQLTVSRNNLANYRLQLRQLLELGIDEDIVLSGADAAEDDVLRLLPPKSEVCANALDNMPEVASGELGVTAAELALKQAQAGFLPSVGMSAGIGTANRAGTGNAFTRQLQDNFNTSLGLNVSIPIVQGRRNRTAVNKARISLDNSRLAAQSTEKAVLREVETAYLDAVSAQAQYLAAQQKEQYSRQSFELTSEQFNVGMKNIVELITAKTEYLSAQQSLLQAKYMALLNLSVLDIYQGKI